MVGGMVWDDGEIKYKTAVRPFLAPSLETRDDGLSDAPLHTKQHFETWRKRAGG